MPSLVREWYRERPESRGDRAAHGRPFTEWRFGRSLDMTEAAIENLAALCGNYSGDTWGDTGAWCVFTLGGAGPGNRKLGGAGLFWVGVAVAGRRVFSVARDCRRAEPIVSAVRSQGEARSDAVGRQTSPLAFSLERMVPGVALGSESRAGGAVYAVQHCLPDAYESDADSGSCALGVCFNSWAGCISGTAFVEMIQECVVSRRVVFDFAWRRIFWAV